MKLIKCDNSYNIYYVDIITSMRVGKYTLPKNRYINYDLNGFLEKKCYSYWDEYFKYYL